jgi:hypothetical protein
MVPVWQEVTFKHVKRAHFECYVWCDALLKLRVKIFQKKHDMIPQNLDIFLLTTIVANHPL